MTAEVRPSSSPTLPTPPREPRPASAGGSDAADRDARRPAREDHARPRPVAFQLDGGL